MDDWSIATYGSPCRECGYRWSSELPGIVDLMVRLPATFRQTLGAAAGSERHPDLDWSVTAYVCHVADNLRIWSERLQGAIHGGSNIVQAYDENRLAEVRGYDAVDLRGALSSLSWATDEWRATVTEGAARQEGGQAVTLVHPERGELTLTEVARANCHDAVHHHYDVGRILAAARR
jgi:hypothetical protein